MGWRQGVRVVKTSKQASKWVSDRERERGCALSMCIQARLDVCMRECISVYLCVCVCACVHACTCMAVSACTCMAVRACACICVCICMCMQVCVCVCVCQSTGSWEWRWKVWGGCWQWLPGSSCAWTVTMAGLRHRTSSCSLARNETHMSWSFGTWNTSGQIFTHEERTLHFLTIQSQEGTFFFNQTCLKTTKQLWARPATVIVTDTRHTWWSPLRHCRLLQQNWKVWCFMPPVNGTDCWIVYYLDMTVSQVCSYNGS